jgi:hypothetical protein
MKMKFGDISEMNEIYGVKCHVIHPHKLVAIDMLKTQPLPTHCLPFPRNKRGCILFRKAIHNSDHQGHSFRRRHQPIGVHVCLNPARIESNNNTVRVKERLLYGQHYEIMVSVLQ